MIAIIVALLIAATPSPTPAARIYLPVIVRAQPPPDTATPTATLTPTRVPVATPTGTTVPLPSGVNVACNTAGGVQICAWVSNGEPAQRSNVTVYGRLLLNGMGQASRAMTAAWHYKTTTSTCVGTTGANGIASCSRNIGGAASGYRVDVDVVIDGYQATTWFTPR